MKYIVTGGAGFIGNRLISSLLGNGHSVIAMDNLCRGSLANIAEFSSNPNFSFYKVNLDDAQELNSALPPASYLKIDAVWHLAANSDIPAGVKDPSVDLRDTFMTTFNILRYMQEANIPEIFFASTSAVYGDHGENELTELTSPLRPISNYGAMKLASEAQISAACESFLKRAIVFRFPNVVGTPATHGVMHDFVHKLKISPNRLQVLGDGSQKKSYLHVSELIDAMQFLVDNIDAKFDVFNVGPDQDSGVTVKFIAETVARIAAPNAQIEYGSGNRGWVGDVPKFNYSIGKIKALGWSPKMQSKETIELAAQEIFNELSK
jgi:UDP-glucose 4-epimerase